MLASDDRLVPLIDRGNVNSPRSRLRCIFGEFDACSDFEATSQRRRCAAQVEGQKTPAFEIAEAFDWTVPDHLIVPGGNLANSSALGKGFKELHELGLVPRIPRISVIQAEGANPLARSFAQNNGERMEPVQANTRATAIRIGNPASWRKAARVIKETGGWCLDVSEAEIAIAKAELGTEGLGCEPASAVTLAGLKKLRARLELQRPG